MSKTGKGLAQYAIAQLGKPYWWGTFGQVATGGLLAAKRNQYPDSYGWNDFESQFGQKVHDCVGLIKGYLWCDTPESEPTYKGYQDVAVGGLYSHCRSSGDLSSIPEIPGVCVFEAGLGHVGVYIGNGKVVEAMGHRYGVVMTDLYSRKWSMWGMPEWISYDNDGDVSVPIEPTRPSKPKPTYFYKLNLPLLKPDMACKEVEKAQKHLIRFGYDCGKEGADGEMGKNTVKAVKKFQSDHNLLVDGEIGIDTWKALLEV